MNPHTPAPLRRNSGISDIAAKQAKPRNKKYHMTDRDGLYLLVMPTGSKSWRWNFHYLGKRPTITYGLYPDLSVSEARILHAAARKLVAQGVNPMEQRKADKRAAMQQARNTFETVATDWIDTRAATWSKAHETKTRQLLKRDVNPVLGSMPIASITSADVLAMARKVEARGNIEMPRRAISAASQVFKFAIGLGLTPNDPALGMSSQLNDRPPPVHFAHVAPEQLPDMLRGLDALAPCLSVLAVKLDMLTSIRGGELRYAEWTEFDRDAMLWRVPPGRMKGRLWVKENGEPHIVPLAPQVLAVLDELTELSGNHRLLFPGLMDPNRPISGEAMAKVWNRLGLKGQQTTHGLRGLMSTHAYESGLFDGQVIEAQLAHQDRNKVRRAYNHASYMDQRRRLMTWWADRLDALKAENVVPLARAA